MHTYGFTGLRVRYDASATLLNKVTENLDSITLVLSWRPPAVRGERTAVNGRTNCVGRYPGGCPLLRADSGAALFVQGTLYAPYGVVDLRLPGATAGGIRSGLVARALLTRVSATTGGPLIEIPNDSSGPMPLEVYFRAYRSSTVVGTAQVRYRAADPTVMPVAGRRGVVVLSWAIRRM